MALAVVGVVALVGALPRVPSLNPFAEERKDRSGPVLLKSLQDLSQYRAATANLQIIIDTEQDARYLPSFLKGERVLFVAAGSVDAQIDFARLGRRGSGGALRVSRDRRTVTVTLPPAELGPVRVDPGRSRVYDRDRGLLDRVGDVFADNPADEQPLYRLAERKLRAAAAGDRALRATAERNTRAMLEGLLRGLGFERITVRFAGPPPA